MASPGFDSSLSRFSQLWQVPLFIVSVAVFVCAGYLFINPGPGITIQDRIDVAKEYLRQDRPEAAFQQLVRILNTEKAKPEIEAGIHLLLAQSLENAQRQLKISIAGNHRRIIEQTQMALDMGTMPTADIRRRLGDSYAALGAIPDALGQYRQAIAMDPQHSLYLRRKVAELQLAGDDQANAEASLNDYLGQPDLTDAERAWAMGQLAGIRCGQDQFGEARKLLQDALRLDTDPLSQGVFNYWMGYCAYREGQPSEAEGYLRLSRDQLRKNHPLDAEAAYYLGKVCQDRGDAPTAISFYDDVIQDHSDSKIADLAMLGRGVSRIINGQNEGGLTDLHDVSLDISRRSSQQKYVADAIASLQQAGRVLEDRQDYQDALETLADRQIVESEPPASFYALLARLCEARAQQLSASLADSTGAERIRRQKQINDNYTRAGDAFVIYSNSLIISDDQGYAEALWKGIDNYDLAGNVQAEISTLELFTTERPADRLAPDALLRLGEAYQAAGLFDKAIATFQKNQNRHPRSLAASKSAVPLAQAYIAKGPEFYGRAEKALLSVVEDNPLVDPSAEEFKESLRELAQLYHQMGRYEEAISRLTELTQRYPDDDQRPRMLFLMADSYRRSAALLDANAAAQAGAQPAAARVGAAATTTDAPAPVVTASDMAQIAAAKRDRLQKARALYDQVIDLYRSTPPSEQIDLTYQKLAYFYRADCVYDLGQYAEAIKLYDAAAFSYQNDASSVAAYVQIVNAYFALGQPQEAKAANNRAKWLLQHMPAGAFQDGTFSMPKKYWDQWLQWTNDSGMW